MVFHFSSSPKGLVFELNLQEKLEILVKLALIGFFVFKNKYVNDINTS